MKMLNLSWLKGGGALLISKNAVIFLFLNILFNASVPVLYSQEATQKSPQITSEKMRLLILPTTSDHYYYYDEEIPKIITSIMAELGRFDVIDRNDLQRILQEQALQLSGVIDDSTVVKVGKIAAAKEALLINVKSMYSVEIKHLDIETSQLRYSINIEAAGKNARKEFKKKATAELKKLYLMKSEIIAVDNQKVTLQLGERVGIDKGTIFVIEKPDQVRKYKNRTITVPGRRAAFVSVEEVSPDANRSVVFRQWRSIQPGDRAVELVKSTHGLQLSFVPPLNNSYYSFGFQYRARAIKAQSWGGEIRFLQVKDSFDENDGGFGLGVFGLHRLLNISRMTLLLKAGADMNIVLRKDDENQGVSTIPLLAYFALNNEIVLSEKADLVISAGYRFGGKSSTWNRTQEGESSVVWKNGAPEVDLSGPFLSVGYKFIFF